MNNNVKRLLVAGMMICLVMVSLSSCSPKLISKTKAKEAGLALINLAFDAEETAADVIYIENRPMNGEGETVLSEENVSRIYEVMIKNENGTDDLYYAEVNAETGVAYYASKSESLLTPLSQDQMNEATELNGLMNEDDTYYKISQESKAGEIAYEWVASRFNTDVTLLASTDIGAISDNIMYPRVRIGYYMVFVDGTVYEVYLYWPTMEVQSIQILSQSVS